MNRPLFSFWSDLVSRNDDESYMRAQDNINRPTTIPLDEVEDYVHDVHDSKRTRLQTIALRVERVNKNR